MSRSYYVIELSARWLTVLLVALAALMVLSFALGYGAATAMRGDGAGGSSAAPTPAVTAEEIIGQTPTVGSPEPTSPAATPTARPQPPTAAAPTATAAPPTPKPTVKPSPTAPAVSGFWVQVLASSRRESITDARAKVERLGFDRDHQRIVRSKVVGGNELIKLRVGPFPDRASADRVLQRMRAAGFPDAWVVVQ